MANWTQNQNYSRVETTAATMAGSLGKIQTRQDLNGSLSSLFSQGGNNESKSLQKDTIVSSVAIRVGLSRFLNRNNTITSSTPTLTFTGAPSLPKTNWKRKRKKETFLNRSKDNHTKATGESKDINDNAMNSTSVAENINIIWKGLTLKANFITRHDVLTTTTASTAISEVNSRSNRRRMDKNNEDEKEKRPGAVQQLPLLPRSIRTTVNVTTTTGGGDKGRILRGKRRMESSSSSRLSFPVLTAGEEFPVTSAGLNKLMMSAATPGTLGTKGLDGGLSSSSGIYSPSSSSGSKKRDNNYIVGGDDALDVGVSRRLLDIHQISSRLHRSFPWEGLGLHHNATISEGSIGHSLTSRIGFNPATTPHTLVFSSLYIVPLILLLGFVVGLIWLVCACTYYTMKRIKFALCPGRANRGSNSKKGKSSNNKASSNNPSGIEDGNKKPEILTPEILEMRRQERLAFLQAECANLEQQLTGLRLASPQSTFEEKSATLTSRASDSDLEYLGASESPPLKRNSISLQDIPQSVIRIRREKELRQIKEEIEYLKSIAQEEKEKAAQVAKALKGSLLITQEFELPGSKPGSPGDTKVEPLSQHISHLKAQRKLNEIRTELEDLAIQLLHADEIKAKRSSLQELPRTALNIQREQNLITMNNEIQKIKNYKLQKKNVIETALEKTNVSPKGASGGGAADSGKQTGSKSFNPSAKSPSTTEDVAAKYSDPEFVRGASIRRQREQELNRVRVELKDLAYKLNLNPMNYISDDRVRLVPSQSMQSTSSITGQTSYNKSTSASSALNHV